MSTTNTLATLLADAAYTVYEGQAPDDAPAPFVWVAPQTVDPESWCLNGERGGVVAGWQIQIAAQTLSLAEDIRDLVLSKTILPWWFTGAGPMFRDESEKPALIVIPLFAERTE